MSKRLSYRAREIEAWVESHLVDDNGILYTFADRTTGKLLSNDLLDSVDPMRLRNSTTAGWWAYENCSMVTGAYMEAMVCRYEVEGDVSALARARRCFHGLRHIYELGKELEEGFMPKIYDNRFTPDTSSDQVLFAMSALDHFHPHATPAEQAEISHMIGAMVRFFVKRDYKYTFYDMQDMAWPLARFTSKNLMAYRHTGDDYFKKEYDRLLALGVNERPGEEYLRPKLAGLVKRSDTEIEVGGWILTIPLYCATMDLMELEYLLRQDPSNPWAGKWRRSIFQMWNEGALSITEDGRAYYSIVVDFETLEVRLLESKFAGNPAPAPSEVAMPDSTVSQLEMPFDANKWSGFAFMLYSHSARTSMSTLYARAGLQVAPLFPKDASIRPVARRIIKAFDLYDLTYFEGPDSFHPRFKYMMNVMSTDSVANWLWGYWQGRAINVFAADE